METLAAPLTPDDIDLGFVAELVPDLETATIGDEQVVIGGATQLVVLNPTAALIFRFLDGETSLADLVDDFAAVLGVDREVVEVDVLTFVRELGANGLLEGVALPKPELPEWGDGWTPPVVLAPGDQLDDFTLPDLAGDDHALTDWRGRRVLLVNWSPGCGFCVAIAAELAALAPLLEEQQVDLVLVAIGDADANRGVVNHAGLVAPLLLRGDTDVDPFAGTGTPAAYLLDEDGRLVETMVVGSDQVPKLARDLAGVDPGAPFGVTDEPDILEDPRDDERGRYLPAPGAMCGPGGGGGGANRTDWKGTRAYAIGDYHVGLRYDGDETAAVLDRLFRGARVNDRRVPDNYSVALGGTPTTNGAGTSRSLKLLVHGGTQLVRSRSGGRVLAGLLQRLSADLTPADPAFTRVIATAAVRDGDALLLPAGLLDFVKQLQPRLAKAGLCIVDSPRTLLDWSTRELVVPEPTVPHDESVVAELDEGVKLGSELPWVRPGRYPLSTWFLTRSPEHTGLLSTAVAVTAALPALAELDELVADVERLADLLSAVATYGIWYESVDDLVDQVVDGLR
jgi:thiol-disulfide isomerase/thioredoxin